MYQLLKVYVEITDISGFSLKQANNDGVFLLSFLLKS